MYNLIGTFWGNAEQQTVVSRCLCRGGEGDNLHIVTIYSVIKQRQPAACAVLQRAAEAGWCCSAAVVRHLQQPRLLPGCSCCSNQAGRCCQAGHCSSLQQGRRLQTAKHAGLYIISTVLHAIDIYTLVCVRYLRHQQIQISSVFSKWVIHLRASHRLIERERLMNGADRLYITILLTHTRIRTDTASN